ncbi:diguanylate cyclase domain-containing protein [Halopseudomonas sabulinigri]|uniref:GGDEF domain-containing protein n=1 Tax=Halopseudomonas sabulinigri TaxID=472181 RepID=A0ABP9ZP56_9GAMM
MHNTPQPAPPTNALDLLLDAVCMVNAEGTFVHVSAASERVFGYPAAELVGRRVLDLVHPDDVAITKATADRVLRGEQVTHFTNRYRRKNGQFAHIMWSARWSEQDQLRIAVARDITAQKRAESMREAVYAISEAASSGDDLTLLFRQIHQIVQRLLPVRLFSIALYNHESGQLDFPYCQPANQADEAALLSPTSLSQRILHSGQPLLLVPPQPAHDNAPAAAENWLGVPLQVQNTLFGAVLLRGDAAGPYYNSEDLELLQYVSAQIAAAIQRAQLQARLQFQSHYDHLTGLPNRALLMDRLNVALARAQREEQGLALLYLDLDNFKQVNDSLGHDVGDLLLQQASRRLSDCVRDCDTVARMGGDEFVILLESVQSEAASAIVAGKICTALRQPFQVGLHQLHSNVSVGVALFPQHADDAHHLLRQADQAMYRAKQEGGSSTRTAQCSAPQASPQPSA